MEPLSKEWVPLFLDFAAAAKGPGSASAAEGGAVAALMQAHASAVEGSSVLSRVGARSYRARLQDWLTFVSGIKGARGLHRWGFAAEQALVHEAGSRKG